MRTMRTWWFKDETVGNSELNLDSYDISTKHGKFIVKSVTKN